MERDEGLSDICLRACPFCGGRPVVLVMQQVLENVVMIQCSECGATSCGVMFRSGRGADVKRRDLLPDLAQARRQAADAWNGKGAAHGEEPEETGPA